MEDGLRLRIWRDATDGTCELEAFVLSGAFSGLGSGWFNLSELDAFAEVLATYPLSERAAQGIASGYGAIGTLEQVHLAISAKEIDAAGHIAVQVRVATPLERTERPESQHHAQVEFRTTYAELARFATRFRSLVAGTLEEAFLKTDAG